MFSGSPQLCWLWAVLCGCVLWISQLRVSVSHTTLRVGETVQLAVTKKIWFGTEPLAHPERTQYITNWESMAVVEPDGKVTAVGTWGEREEMIPAASIGRLNLSAHRRHTAQRRHALHAKVVFAPGIVGRRPVLFGRFARLTA